jgi:glutamine amidotransferase
MADPDRPGFRLKIPHMGWNTVLTTGNHPLTAAVVDGGYYYFVHSFHVMPDDPAVIAATTDYGIRFVSAVAHDNIFATQFHPEKSQHHGLALLTAFGRLVERGA